LYKQQATGVLYTRINEVDLLIKRYKRTHKQVDTLPTVAPTINTNKKEVKDLLAD